MEQRVTVAEDSGTPPRSPMSEDSASSHRQSPGLNDATPPSARSASDEAIPHVISYSLKCEFEKARIPELDGEVLLDQAQNYKEIEITAEKHVRLHGADFLARRQLHFRNGNCTIIGDKTTRHNHALSSQEDWKEVRTVLFNLWTSETHRNFHLEIRRNFFGIKTRIDSDITLFRTKAVEIRKLMKRTFDNRLYIPRTDLMRVVSADTIREIIVEEPPPNMQDDDRDSFIETVQKEAPKLTALCIHVNLKMKCLKILLDKGHKDSDLPLGPFEEKKCCHSGCEDRYAENYWRIKGDLSQKNFGDLENTRSFTLLLSFPSTIVVMLVVLSKTSKQVQ